jgi:hypothetical protein
VKQFSCEFFHKEKKLKKFKKGIDFFAPVGYNISVKKRRDKYENCK